MSKQRQIRTPCAHIKEQDRLNELRRLRILDTADDRRFDRITGLVAKTLGFPTVLISLIDENRQWFKSRHNFEATETARDISFCGHTINTEDGMLIIPNALNDNRFEQNPLVTSGPKIRAYAGIVLRSANRLPLGTLCVLDYKPRDFSGYEVEILREFAEIAETELLKNLSSGPWADLVFGPQMLVERQVMSANELTTSVDQLCASNPDVDLVAFVIDTPRLPQVRRAYGSEIGQALCTELAKRVRIGLTNRRFILGDDHERLFAGVVERADPSEDVARIADALHFTIGNRIQTSAVTVTTPIHVGFSAVKKNNNGPEIAFQQARLAIDSLKSPFSGVSCSVYQCGMSERVERHRSIIAKLQAALDENRIELHFQPKVSLDANDIVGAEALIRWHDDDLGYISPPEILEAAETMDQLVSLDDWVFHRACRHMADWQQRGIGLKSLSVNICGDTLARPDFVKWARDVAAKFDLEPNLIDFEILESAVLFDIADTVEKIRECQKRGFTFSLDDFGTGQSSLSHLGRLPLNHLKIDKSFTDDVVQDRTRSAMTYQIIEIGHSLGKSVVVEGVENIGQYLIIRSFGCDVIQGYYFSKPLPDEKFVALMTDGGGKLKPAGVDEL